MGAVIQMHETRAARADGVALAVACAARRLGLSSDQVIRCAEAAHDRMLKAAGKVSAASVVADAKAEIRAALPAVMA